MDRRGVLGSAVAFSLLAPLAAAQAVSRPRIATEDARRFVRLYRASHGRPDREILQTAYLARGSEALTNFDRDAIGGAERMAAAIASYPTAYNLAVERCLGAAPVMTTTAHGLLADYRRLLPDFPTPEVHLLFGSRSSAGMKLEGARIAIAPERLFEGVEWAERFRALLAHEMAHVAQPDLADDDPQRRDLLAWALREGAANFLAALVLGRDPSGAANRWAIEREQDLYAQFLEDREIMRSHWRGVEPEPIAIKAGQRWMWNQASPDRPADLAYWIGQRFWFRHYSRANDKVRAVRDMAALRDIDAVVTPP